jgi:hypothetical protein
MRTITPYDRKKEEKFGVNQLQGIQGNVVISIRSPCKDSSVNIWKVDCTDRATKEDVENCMERVMQALMLIDTKIEEVYLHPEKVGSLNKEVPIDYETWRTNHQQ